MQAILVRVGVDQQYGKWNAPADPRSRHFVYVPIPEKVGTQFRPGLGRPYTELLPVLKDFSTRCGLSSSKNLGFPYALLNCAMHLDPDFQYLTYGDNGEERGFEIARLERDDLLIFYSGFKSILPSRRLIYALIGIYVVREILRAVDVQSTRRVENAHTRKLKIGSPDIVVRAKEGVSGRLTRFIPIGEFRNRAYRVEAQLLEKWGGLTVRDGFIQRSARPPSFLDPEKFYQWFLDKKPKLIARNNQ